MGNIDLGILIAFAFACVFCLGLLWDVYVSAREWGTQYWLKRSGTIANGQIIGRRQRNGGKTARFCVVYSFNVKLLKTTESNFNREQQISWRHYARLDFGTPVKIIYLPSNPNISRLAGPDLDNTVRDSSTIVAVIVMIAMPPLLIFWLIILFLELPIWMKLSGQTTGLDTTPSE